MLVGVGYAALEVHAYEVWNEPNTVSFWKPAPSPAAYTALLKQIGIAAREELQRELDTQVHLDLSARVRTKGWRGDERALGRLGIE